MRGRLRQPTAIRVLRGNPSKEPIPPEPRVSALLPPCPFHAGPRRELEACRTWHRLVRLLGPAGVLRASDAEALAAYCETWSRWLEAADHVRREGMVIQTDRGPARSPWWDVFEQASRQLRMLAAELGLTPAARARVAAGLPQVQRDELDELRRA